MQSIQGPLWLGSCVRHVFAMCSPCMCSYIHVSEIRSRGIAVAVPVRPGRVSIFKVLGAKRGTKAIV
jgi:hypothetical protein